MRNVWAFAAALLISLVLWLNVQPLYDPDKEKEIPVRLEMRNLPEGLAPVEWPESVTVTASGTSSEVDSVSSASFAAYVDLTGATAGQKDYPVQVIGPSRPTGAVRPTRANARILLARVASDTRSVELEQVGLPPTEYLVDGASIQPETVTISGPDTFLSSVRKVRVLLDLSRVRPRSEFSLEVEMLDEDGRPVPLVRSEPKTVVVSPAVASAPASKRVLVQPMFRGQPAIGYRVTGVEVRPSQVALTGSSQDLARVTVVETSEVSIEGLRATTTLTANLALPPGLRASGGSQVRVVVKIEAAPAPVTP